VVPAALDQETLYTRFSTYKKRLTAAELRQLTQVDVELNAAGGSGRLAYMLPAVPNWPLPPPICTWCYGLMPSSARRISVHSIFAAFGRNDHSTKSNSQQIIPFN